MAEEPGAKTSETLARALNTNPVVVRRIMAGLREHGFVSSEKGHGGAGTAGDLAVKMLRDIYDAVGGPEILATSNRNDAPGCLVEHAVNAALGQALHECPSPPSAPLWQSHAGAVERRLSLQPVITARAVRDGFAVRTVNGETSRRATQFSLSSCERTA